MLKMLSATTSLALAKDFVSQGLGNWTCDCRSKLDVHQLRKETKTNSVGPEYITKLLCKLAQATILAQTSRFPSIAEQARARRHGAFRCAHAFTISALLYNEL